MQYRTYVKFELWQENTVQIHLKITQDDKTSLV
jgi:hypothetical protein